MLGPVLSTYKQYLSSPFNTISGTYGYSQFIDEKIGPNVARKL